MTSIESITLEAPDVKAAETFYADAFGDGVPLNVRASEKGSEGFRGYTISLLVAQPANVSALIESGLAAGATTLKPAAKSMWGFGGVVQAPDGAIWKVATSAKKDAGPATKQIDKIVVLIGVDDVSASKKFYVEHGLKVGRSFGSYVDFDLGTSPVGFGLYKRRALAKDAGVPEEGSGSHRIVIGGGAAFTDPDGFAWA